MANINAAVEFRGTFSQGTWGTFSIRLFGDDRVPYDPPSIRVVLTDVTSAATEIFDEVPVKITNGWYVFDWPIPDDQEAGTYAINWLYTVDGADEISSKTFEIAASGTSTATHNARYISIRNRLEDKLMGYQCIPILNEQAMPTSDMQTYKFEYFPWNQTSTVNVYRNNRLITSGFEVDYLGGNIVFEIPNLKEDQINIDYNFRFFSDDKLRGFLEDAANIFNTFAPHTAYRVASMPDLYIPTMLHGAAVTALRTFMSAMFWPKYRVLFGDNERADKAFEEAETLKKNYEETWYKLLDEKRKGPYKGLTASIITPQFTLPGGQARYFRYMFASGN
jgi:hypothetical protein